MIINYYYLCVNKQEVRYDTEENIQDWLFSQWLGHLEHRDRQKRLCGVAHTTTLLRAFTD